MFAGPNSQLPLASLPGTFRSNISAQGGFSQDDYTTFWESLFYDRRFDTPATIAAESGNGSLYYCELKTDNNGINIKQEELQGPPPTKTPTVNRPGQQGQQAPQPGFTWRVQVNGQVGGSGRPNPCAVNFIVISTRLEHPISDADLFNQITLMEGGEERLVNLLKQIDGRLEKMRYVKAPRTSQPLVYAYFGMKHALAVTQTGQGFSKLFSLYCRMLLSKAKIVFIDEIENGLYYETLIDVWKGIAALATSEKIQIFATTHSRECILAAHEVMKAEPNYDFALHRLQRVKGKIEAVTHDRGMLEAAIKSGLEVR
jgi:hypothetical protein